jgi:hypothetical protein
MNKKTDSARTKPLAGIILSILLLVGIIGGCLWASSVHRTIRGVRLRR